MREVELAEREQCVQVDAAERAKPQVEVAVHFLSASGSTAQCWARRVGSSSNVAISAGSAPSSLCETSIFVSSCDEALERGWLGPAAQPAIRSNATGCSAESPQLEIERRVGARAAEREPTFLFPRPSRFTEAGERTGTAMVGWAAVAPRARWP